MLTLLQKSELERVAGEALDSAEQIWNEIGDELVVLTNAKAYMSKFTEKVIDTQIPGYPTVEPGKPKVDDFIAIVADMRGSTTHLLCAISHKRASVNQLQRVFYETAALLPSLAKTIEYENGKVTEYLGDGVLGLFCLNKNEKNDTIYAANRAAHNCLEVVGSVVNPLLAIRYSLPPLDIGIGLAYSKAVVTLVGLPNFMQPKVFGECVFRASKLSTAKNEILIDEALKCIWPTAKGGVLRFLPKSLGGVDGFIVKRK